MSKIISIKEIRKPEYTYNLHVQDNHNYFANNIMAEPVYIFDKQIDVRPLWTIEEDWELK